MGGEGTPWIGQAPFTTRRHMFANLGDGTYNHSGLLAVRQSINAGVNLTYKILFNSAVAMTGGQPVDGGGLSVPAMTRELEAEGVVRIAVVTDEPERYATVTGLAAGVEVHHRNDLAARAAAAARRRRCHGDRLRPGMRHQEAPRAQARHDGRPGQARGDQRARVRRLRRLLRAEQLPCRAAGGD